MTTGRPHGRSRRRRMCLISHAHTAKLGSQADSSLGKRWAVLASGQPCSTSRHTAKAARMVSPAIETATAPASRKAAQPVA